MTARLQPDDLTRQLRSLSIVRDQEDTSARRAPPAKAGPKWPWALALVLAGLTFGGWTQRDRIAALWPAAVGPSTQVQPKVAVAAPVPTQTIAPLTAGLVGSGYMVAERQSVIGADPGGRVADLRVAVGDMVRKGQVLARLDDRAARLSLALTRGDLDMARADLARLEILRSQAAAKAERQAALSARGAAPAAITEDMGFALKLAEADLALARQTIAQRQIVAEQAADALVRLTITAPFDGLIVETRATVGDLVGSALDGGQVPGLAVLLDIQSLRVEADFAETALAGIAVDQKAEVVLDAWPYRRIPAHVEAILPRASLQKGTITLRLKLDDAEIVPLTNMAAKVTLLAKP